MIRVTTVKLPKSVKKLFVVYSIAESLTNRKQMVLI